MQLKCCISAIDGDTSTVLLLLGWLLEQAEPDRWCCCHGDFRHISASAVFTCLYCQPMLCKHLWYVLSTADYCRPLLSGRTCSMPCLQHCACMHTKPHACLWPVEVEAGLDGCVAAVWDSSTSGGLSGYAHCQHVCGHGPAGGHKNLALASPRVI